ncbi:hypothetical protein [Rhodoferax sp.]|nr:hypothetical protein [Rhodoferax sp.]
MNTFPDDFRVLVIGDSGCIGQAFCKPFNREQIGRAAQDQQTA